MNTHILSKLKTASKAFASVSRATGGAFFSFFLLKAAITLPSSFRIITPTLAFLWFEKVAHPH